MLKDRTNLAPNFEKPHKWPKIDNFLGVFFSKILKNRTLFVRYFAAQIIFLKNFWKSVRFFAAQIHVQSPKF